MSLSSSVSVVIPVHNGEAFVAMAIDSVLSQTKRPHEVFVVDDGSTDDTGAIIDSFGHRVRKLVLHRCGVSAARNAGARAATGSLVAFLDADDMWLPQKLELQIRALQRRPHVGLVYTGLILIDVDGGEQGYLDAPAPSVALRNTLLLERPHMSVAQTSLMPRGLFLESGGFDETLSTSADIDLACRLAMTAPVEQVPEHLVMYRQHPGQMHRDPDLTERDCLEVFEKLFAHPLLPQSLAKGKRRAEANLYASLAGRHIRRGDWRSTFGCAWKASLRRPDRALAGLSRMFTSPYVRPLPSAN